MGWARDFLFFCLAPPADVELIPFFSLFHLLFVAYQRRFLAGF